MSASLPAMSVADHVCMAMACEADADGWVNVTAALRRSGLSVAAFNRGHVALIQDGRVRSENRTLGGTCLYPETTMRLRADCR